MADDTENHTLLVLQEMRGDMKEMRQEFGALRQEMHDGFDHVNTRIDGLSHIVTLLAANMGGHEQRIEALEETVSTLSQD